MSSGRGGFRVGSGRKRKIPEESAEAEDGVQQRRRLGAPTNFSSEENQNQPIPLFVQNLYLQLQPYQV